MIKKILLKLFLVKFIFLSSLLFSFGVAYAENTVKIGVLNPLTGLYAIVGKRASQGINMAVDEINQSGGILGMKLEALIRDSETNPDSSVRTGKRLILQDKVVALFGPLHGGAAIAVNNLAKQLKTPQFPWAATEEINTTMCSRYTWRVGSSAQQTSRAGALIAYREGYKNWSSISSDFSYGRSVVNQFKDYLTELDNSSNFKYQAWPKLGEDDYSAYITNIAKEKPEALYVGLFGADLIKFTKQAKAFGLFDKLKIFTDFGGNHIILKVLGDNNPFGHWASSRYLHYYPETEANKNFVKNFRARYDGVYPDMVAGEAYSTTMILAKAIQKAGSADKEKIVDALGETVFNAPEGWIIMRPSDHQGWQSSFWGVISKDSSYDFPILKNIQVISPVQGSHADEKSGQGCK